MESVIDRPIFIVGPHRSGTTLLYNLLGAHPEAGYYNRADRRLPGRPRLARWLTRAPLGFADDPMEAQRVWDRFRAPDSDDRMDASDATPGSTAWHRRSVAGVLAARGASRFLAKYPRLSMRVPWLDAVFPGAIFLHFLRDWRAVVNSTVARIEKRRARGGGWFGVRIPGWLDVPADAPPEPLAARIFRVATERLEADARPLGDRYVRARYEDLCAAPRETMRSICERTGLAWTDAFEATVPTELRSANDKWRRRLTPEILEPIRAEAPDFFSAHEAG